MRRRPALTCFNKADNHTVMPWTFAIVCPAVCAFCLFLIPLSITPVYAEGTKIFTDADLEKYQAPPMVDHETQTRSEKDLNSFLKKKSAELLREEKEMKRRQDDEAKRLAAQKKATVTQVPVTVQRTTARRT
ncbi:MAG: hypothetical protein HZB31_08235 [Nitrospirae bacterium]|nr:hypothetical protein [Nitrospirota bacterium]